MKKGETEVGTKMIGIIFRDHKYFYIKSNDPRWEKTCLCGFRKQKDCTIYVAKKQR